MQRVAYPIGEAWRETVLVQVGWSFLAASVLVVVFGIIRSRRPSPVAAAAAAVLVVCMLLTLLANARLNRVDRNTPLHVISNEIAAASVHFDPTEGGNARRCRLIDDYTMIFADGWLSGPNVGAELDKLMLDRHGQPFCEVAWAEE